MVATALVGDLVETGRKLILDLDEMGVVVDTAFWALDAEADQWQFVIASPDVDRHGPRNVYGLISTLLGPSSESGVASEVISVRGVRDRLIKDLKRRLQTNGALHDLRLDYVSANGRFFRLMRVYRAAGGSLENGARVTVKAIGRLGTVTAVIDTPSGPRYMVMYDMRPEDFLPLDSTPRQPSGQDYGADELELLYVVRSENRR